MGMEHSSSSTQQQIKEKAVDDGLVINKIVVLID